MPPLADTRPDDEGEALVPLEGDGNVRRSVRRRGAGGWLDAVPLQSPTPMNGAVTYVFTPRPDAERVLSASPLPLSEIGEEEGVSAPEGDSDSDSDSSGIDAPDGDDGEDATYVDQDRELAERQRFVLLGETESRSDDGYGYASGNSYGYGAGMGAGVVPGSPDKSVVDLILGPER